MVGISNKGKAACIVALVKREVDLAASKHINAVADLARAETGDKLWRKYKEQDNIGFSQCPYNIPAAKALVATTLAERMTKQELLDYTIDVFLTKIPEDE